MVPRHDPGTAAEIHRLELVQPGAFPVLILDRAEAATAPVQLRIEGLQRSQQQQRVAVGGEQRAQYQRVPQRGLAHARLKDGLLVAGIGLGIEQGDRQCAHIFKRVFIAGLWGFGATQGQFQERHGGGGNRGKGGHARPSRRLRMP
ncbi:hypothetical protein G6F40_015217 [Rhizopus arrhizus]|nr:hypothetical protein G6F40_015217 [Rhizopus arrhizus]